MWGWGGAKETVEREDLDPINSRVLLNLPEINIPGTLDPISDSTVIPRP